MIRFQVVLQNTSEWQDPHLFTRLNAYFWVEIENYSPEPETSQKIVVQTLRIK